MTEMVFSFKPGSKLKGDPQRVGEELESVRSKSGGLSAAAVVAAARPRQCYLHQYFTWDDRAAAEKCRTEEARHLIRSVTVRFAGDESPAPVPVRAFVAVGQDEERYMPMAVVLSRDDLRAKLLAKAVEELSWFRQKYTDLHELTRVFDAIDEVAAATVVK